MENELSYTLDTSKISYIREKCKQLDNRPLVLSLYDNNSPYTLTGATLELRAKKPDGTFVIQSNNISVSSNIVTINPLNVDITRVAGIVSLELKITKTSLSVTTFTFELEVIEGVIQQGDTQSSNTISALEELETTIDEANVVLKQVDQAAIDLNNLITSGGAVKVVDYNAKMATLDGITNEHLEVINDALATIGGFNVANFAGQSLGINAPIANILHNYTDAPALQIDEVGEGNPILILKNANNPGRRPDKAADYIGNAHFLDCIKHNAGGGSSLRFFRVSSTGNLYWFDKTDTVLLYNNKPNDSTPGFQFEAGTKQTKIIQIQNGGATDLQINHNATTNYLDILAGAGVLGMTIQNITGDIQIKPASSKLYVNGLIYAYANGAYAQVHTCASSTTATRPTPTAIGQTHFDTTLNKPIWCKQYTPSVIWVDATGATV